MGVSLRMCDRQIARSKSELGHWHLCEACSSNAHLTPELDPLCTLCTTCCQAQEGGRRECCYYYIEPKDHDRWTAKPLKFSKKNLLRAEAVSYCQPLPDVRLAEVPPARKYTRFGGR